MTLISDYKQSDGVMVPSLTRKAHDVKLGRSIAKNVEQARAGRIQGRGKARPETLRAAVIASS